MIPFNEAGSEFTSCYRRHHKAVCLDDVYKWDGISAGEKVATAIVVSHDALSYQSAA